ncbi:hypothetical protein CROQUDRAFT_396905 [Cronartium quercuum f. sp. fusiforme G11]|uniref:Uncharacterized protein n=1 Tax=Cronartium quercuum f. sp. fusiforme G11 TaxID=708437 RepID=A0A9P6NRX4_9BASI|nr:hypothetical protein CROQUDRAFT_396905 [Cronartium quercuum f. sp. fusiforme G11]
MNLISAKASSTISEASINFHLCIAYVDQEIRKLSRNQESNLRKYGWISVHTHTHTQLRYNTLLYTVPVERALHVGGPRRYKSTSLYFSEPPTSGAFRTGTVNNPYYFFFFF